jgi:hypothetical protein
MSLGNDPPIFGKIVASRPTVRASERLVQLTHGSAGSRRLG